MFSRCAGSLRLALHQHYASNLRDLAHASYVIHSLSDNSECEARVPYLHVFGGWVAKTTRRSGISRDFFLLGRARLQLAIRADPVGFAGIGSSASPGEPRTPWGGESQELAPDNQASWSQAVSVVCPRVRCDRAEE